MALVAYCVESGGKRQNKNRNKKAGVRVRVRVSGHNIMVTGCGIMAYYNTLNVGNRKVEDEG